MGRRTRGAIFGAVMASRMIASFLELFGLFRWRIIGRYADMDELPDDIPARGVALVSVPGRLKWMIFDCPCGQGHRIMLNADNNRRPFWRMIRSDPLTIWPSVDFQGNRRCHYSIRNGRTVWARDSD
jgi:hypothetical protein